MKTTNLRIGDILVEKGYVTPDQMNQALAWQKEHRDKRVGQILMELGFVSESQVLDALASRLHLNIVDVAQLSVDLQAVGKVSREVCEKNLILPVSLQGHNMEIVTNDPLNYFALEEVRQQTGCHLEISLSEEEPLRKAISYYFAEVNARKAATQANVDFAVAAQDEIEIEDLESGDDEAPIIRLLNSLIERAIKTEASDIHIEPFETETKVRMRIDGVIMEYVTIQRNIHAPLIARIKILSNLDIAEIPQDGHFRVTLEGGSVNIRVSILPTVFGEKAVLRIMAATTHMDHADHFGMDDYSYNQFAPMLNHPNGIIYITGPTGSGKTYLVKTLARLLDVPLAITDATSLTEAGYIGDDIESVVSKLLAAADNDVERAEQGIIFIDEIDKIAKKKTSSQRDVSGESVQQGMLKLLEGSEVEVPVGANSKNAMVPLTTVNTKNILFICGGAFPDIEEIIKERLQKKTSMGFNSELKDTYEHDENLLSKVTVEDLRKFGMIPEFLGRLPIIFTLKGLDKEMLVKILREPKNAILKQYQKLLALDEVKLDFDDSALEAIAEKAMEKDTGARALRAIIEEFMLDIMYEIPKDDNIGRVTITKNYIEGTGGPAIQIRGAGYAIPDKQAEAAE